MSIHGVTNQNNAVILTTVKTSNLMYISYAQAKSFHLISLTFFLLITLERLVGRYKKWSLGGTSTERELEDVLGAVRAFSEHQGCN
jgi:hypothetical protein